MAKKVLPKKFHSLFSDICSEGNIEELEKLFDENNMDINCMLYRPDKPARSYSYNRYLFMEMFNLTGNYASELTSFFISRNVDLSLTGCDGQNVLWNLRMFESSIPVLAQLIEGGVDIDQKDRDGNSFLNSLVRAYGDLDIVIDEDDELFNREVKEVRFKMIEMLLQHGADPDCKNSYDTSPNDWINHRIEENASDGRLEAVVEKYAK